jgi:hypothetical protein
MIVTVIIGGLDNAGPERRSVRQYLRDRTLPSKYDPSKDADIGDVDKKRRIFLNRQSPWLCMISKF